MLRGWGGVGVEAVERRSEDLVALTENAVLTRGLGNKSRSRTRHHPTRTLAAARFDAQEVVGFDAVLDDVDAQAGIHQPIDLETGDAQERLLDEPTARMRLLVGIEQPLRQEQRVLVDERRREVAPLDHPRAVPPIRQRAEVTDGRVGKGLAPAVVTDVAAGEELALVANVEHPGYPDPRTSHLLAA